MFNHKREGGMVIFDNFVRDSNTPFVFFKQNQWRSVTDVDLIPLLGGREQISSFKVKKTDCVLGQRNVEMFT